MTSTEHSTPLPDSLVERKLEAAERLLACYRRVVGHDLPNHLVSVQGLARVLELEQHEHLTEEGRDYVQRLAGAARRAHELVRALAELGRIGREPQPVEAVSLAEIAHEAAAEVRQLSPERSIDYHFPQAQLILLLPRRMLRLVLVQLFRNAVQAVPGDGSVRIEIEGQVRDTGQEFWVADNGRGLTDAQQRQLRAFFAGQEALGSGMGLFLVRQILDTWGGHLQVECRPGGGSVFRVSIPGSHGA